MAEGIVTPTGIIDANSGSKVSILNYSYSISRWNYRGSTQTTTMATFSGTPTAIIGWVNAYIKSGGDGYVFNPITFDTYTAFTGEYTIDSWAIAINGNSLDLNISLASTNTSATDYWYCWLFVFHS